MQEYDINSYGLGDANYLTLATRRSSFALQEYDIDPFDMPEQGGDAPERWEITDDGMADWALRTIREIRQAEDRQIAHHEHQAELARSRRKNRVANLEYALSVYFETIPARDTKTQKKFALPSGELVLKKGKDDYQPDGSQLVLWLKENGYADYVKVEEKPVWGELKKRLSIVDGAAVDKETGEIVGGIQIISLPAEFVVDPKTAKPGSTLKEEAT